MNNDNQEPKIPSAEEVDARFSAPIKTAGDGKPSAQVLSEALAEQDAPAQTSAALPVNPEAAAPDAIASTPTEEQPSSEKTEEELNAAPAAKPVSKMNRTELAEYAASQGVAFPEDATKAQIREALEAAQPAPTLEEEGNQANDADGAPASEEENEEQSESK